MTRPTADSFIYVTRLPPSTSGVAAYASAFLDALRALGDVQVERLAAEPTSSQSLGLGVRLAVRLERATRHAPDRVVFVEQAGRGVAEFWAAWYLALRGRRVWVMVHDVPELSGGAFFTSVLDRRGGRRLANALSSTVGRAAEGALLTRAERVLCLSSGGARALETTYGLERPVEAVPHVAPQLTASETARTEVFVPGYIGSWEDVLPLVRCAERLPDGWALTIGAGAPDTVRRIAQAAAEAGVEPRVHMLGFTSEEELQRAFDHAAVVVRWRRAGWGGSGPAGLYAVSGPLIAAMAHGCAVVTNDTRGTRESFGEAQVIEVEDGDAGERQVIDAVIRLAADPVELRRRGEAGRALVRRAHSATAVAGALRA